MSISGVPSLSLSALQDVTVAIVASSWHNDVVDELLAGAGRVLAEAKVPFEVYRVHGAMEIPIVTQEIIRHVDAVIALGVVIRGETPHFDHVCHIVNSGLLRVSLDERTPIGNGILTVETLEQAVQRSGGAHAQEDKGGQAAAAALDAARTIQRVRTKT